MHRRLMGLELALVCGALLAPACAEQLPIDSTPCPCASGYVCCASGYCAAGATLDACDAVPPRGPIATEITLDLMSRWNAVPATPEPVTDDRGYAIEFPWNVSNEFPHPTYRGGSPTAYQAFAARLASFFQHGDNFEHLTQKRLFKFPLKYTFPGGGDGGMWTFDDLAFDLSRKTPGLPAGAEATRAVLEMYSARIRGTCTGADCSAAMTPSASAAESEMMGRWNAAPHVGDPISLPSVGVVSFVWKDLTAFPHPSAKGGGPAAVQLFAELLAGFYQSSDNLDFLVASGLTLYPLRYLRRDGQSASTTFDDLTAELARTEVPISDRTREALLGASTRMRTQR